MKNITFFVILYFIYYTLNAQGVAINADNSVADASAALDVKSTTGGMLIPRLTAAQRALITTPSQGLMVFQTDGTSGFYYFNGTIWTTINDNLGNHTATTNLNLNNNNITNVNNLTATGTANLSTNSYPTNTGTNGQVLNTDGSGTLTWGSASPAKIVFFGGKDLPQTYPVGSSLTDGQGIVRFDAERTGPTIGTWTDDSVYTVAQNGLYLISSHIVSERGAGGVIAPNAPYIIVKDASNNEIYRIFGTACSSSATFGYGSGGRGEVSAVFNLSVGNTIRIRYTNPSTTATNVFPITSSAAMPWTQDACRITIVKLN